MILPFNFMLTPLVSTQPLDPSTGLTDLPTFIQNVFPLLVQIIAGVAVLTIAYWGLRYMLNNVAGIKGMGREKIWNALLGLLLALAAMLILNIINPNIIKSLECFVSTGPKPPFCSK